MDFNKRLSVFFTKLTQFEYWPFWIFYFPLYFYGLYLAFKSRSFMYFSAVNPCMKYGGVMGESKFKVLSLIPKDFIPKTIFVHGSTPFSSIVRTIENEGLTYPFIIKPDVGERGKDVEIIQDLTAFKNYLAGKAFDLIVQQYIDCPLEFGVLYHRMPGSPKGQVTSVIQKGFLSITGDGVQDLKSLIAGEIRTANRLDYLYKKFEFELDVVLPAGEKKYLEPIGNHCRGTTFHNANHLIDDRLQQVFNNISLQIEGFYYGRFDLKVPSLKDLWDGSNIKILELNGVSSEVAHVYDPGYKLWSAYKDIAWHMDFIYNISKENHALGVKYGSLWDFLSELRQHLGR